MTDRPVEPSHRYAKNRPDWPDSDRIEVIERYQAGETANALADAFDVRRATIFSLATRAGFQTRYRVLDDADVAVAQSVYGHPRSVRR